MGVLTSIFSGLFRSSSMKYSPKQRTLSVEEIKRLVSRLNVNTLREKEAEMVEDAVTKARLGDGMISLRQIHEVLKKLRYTGVDGLKISDQDRRGLMKVFEEHFGKS